jgi:hypothetical protein
LPKIVVELLDEKLVQSITYIDTTQNRVVITAYVDAFNRGDIEGVGRLFPPDAEIFGVLARGGLVKAIPIWE